MSNNEARRSIERALTELIELQDASEILRRIDEARYVETVAEELTEMFGRNQARKLLRRMAVMTIDRDPPTARRIASLVYCRR